MYSSDLVEWLIVMLVRGKTGEIYNVGSDVPISIADLAQKVRDLSLAKNQIEISLTADQIKAVERYIPCVKKASRALSLKLKVDLNHSILNTLKMTCR
jgi:dTDP-glucose 4,6-dehydratase